MIGGVILLCFTGWLWRDFCLQMVGQFLKGDVSPQNGDVIVVLRGDSSYARVLEAAVLYKEGYAKIVYISSALEDQNTLFLKKHGVKVDSEQLRLAIILMKLGIPRTNVLLGWRKPGGGTLGEIRRVKAMMTEKGYKRVIMVTNWWHTKRTKSICISEFKGTGISFYVVSPREGISTPSDWWRFRYEAVNVLEEFPKLLIHYLFPSSHLKFSDDPGNVN